MSHGHRYRGKFRDRGQMSPAPSLSWLKYFPGDNSLRGVIPVRWAFDSSSFCYRHLSGHNKAQLSASIYISYFLSFSPQAVAALSPEATLSAPPWQSGGNYYSHLKPADTPVNFHYKIDKVALMISRQPISLMRFKKCLHHQTCWCLMIWWLIFPLKQLQNYYNKNVFLLDCD